MCVCPYIRVSHTHTHPHTHLCFGDIYKLEHDQELYTLCESIACDKFLKLHAGNNSTTCNSSAHIASIFAVLCETQSNDISSRATENIFDSKNRQLSEW